MENTLSSKKNRMLIQEIYANRRLVWNLAKNDFKTRYSGSFLGMAWGFIQPVITVLVYWFVFTVAMGFDKIEGVPYALWLVSGLVPWFFFSDGLTGGTTSMLEYSYLVKKVVFNIDILPVVKVPVHNEQGEQIHVLPFSASYMRLAPCVVSVMAV